jgi:YhcH/YjgK/YiaL family protein
MIYDRFENLDLYCQPGTRLHRALVYVRDVASTVAEGRTELEGDRLYASVSTYDTSTREERRFEAHKKYIDVQAVLEGEECIDVSLEKDLPILEAYDDKKEVMFLRPPKEFASLVMQTGCLADFYPQDVHRPGCNLRDQRRVRKLVVKVQI